MSDTSLSSLIPRRPTGVPQSLQAEESVLGRLLAKPELCVEVAHLLEPRHFWNAHTRLIYGAIHEAFYANQAIDPLTIGAKLAKPLSELLGDCTEAEAVERVSSLASHPMLASGSVSEHAQIIRRQSERRALLQLANAILEQVDEDEDPQAIAAHVGEHATKIATDTVTANEIVSFGDAGRRFIQLMRYERAAKQQGVELGVHTGIRAIDDYTRGFRPGRVYVFGGEPGVGKSAVSWVAAKNHAEHQSRKPKAERIGTLILSMEMGEEDSSSRFAQALTGIDADTFSDVTYNDAQLERVVNEWARRRELPLYLNYAPRLRTSQMLALISDAIRRHNVGFVVIDHFRTFDLDRRLANKNDEDEEKIRFLKEQIARAMNVAVMVLAHTRKPEVGAAGGRPQMADLRGSGQISAHADYVAFLYRPALYASEREIEEGDVSQTDAEIIYRKSRHGPTGTGTLYYNPAKMSIL